MTKETNLKFPCSFPIKVMGKNSADFEAEILSIVNKHVSDLAEGALKLNQSKSGTYLSITITIEAQSKQQLDNLYIDLSACEKVIMAL